MNALSFTASRMGILLAGLLAISQSSCEQGKRVPPVDIHTIEYNDSVVTNRLWQIWSVLRDALGDQDRFPASLSALSPEVAKPELFISPGTGSVVGALSALEEWSDYVYVGGATEDVPLAALLVSPPQNHSGRYGYVMCVAGKLVRLSPAEISAIMANPCLLATNTPKANIDLFKQTVHVLIPKRLRQYYGKSARDVAN